MRAIDALDRAASRWPQRAFLQQGSTRVTYAEAVQLTERIAARLQAEQIAPGTRVAFLSPNDWRGLIAMYGIWRAGLVLVPVNVRNSVSMNLAILQQHAPQAMLYHSEVSTLATGLRAALPQLQAWACLDRADGGAPSLMEWMAPTGARAAEVPHGPLDAWTLYSTSGTTGASKGVMHTHLSNYVSSMDMLMSMRVHEPKRHLVVAPMTHFAGSFIHALTFAGSTHLLLDSTDPAAILEAMAREQIQILFLPPTVIYALLAQPELSTHDFSRLEHFVYAAAPMATEKLREALAAFGPVMMNMYGQAEGIGPITFLEPSAHLVDQAPAAPATLRSIGHPAISRQVGVMREDGSLCTPGETGEVVMRDWVSRHAYLDNPAATDAAHRHGWYHTGDIGVQDAEGRFTLLDRKKDMIVSGGFNVYSAAVEECLMAHPAVLEACVFGIPDDRWGEAVHSMVELKPGQDASAAELQAHVRQDMGAVHAPKQIEFMSPLPRSATGKVLKRELRERYWTGRDRRI